MKKVRHKAKMPKIKIPRHDLKSFLVENMEIDPFWHDLYGINTDSNKYKNKK